jgi:selenide,water dikinase
MYTRNLKKLAGCGGCTAKLPAGKLKAVLESIPKFTDEHLLVGFDSSDDGAVYRLTEDLAIIQTLDFFPPVTDDAYTFGKIAAANALSDVYAMGGEVKLALNIVCFPEKEDPAVLGEILRGGAEKVLEAGGVLCGGHSIHDEGIKYGLSVTGTAHPGKIYQNNRCRLGDVIILTKPLGTGIIMAAYTAFAERDAYFQAAVKSMETLNKYAADILKHFPVSACTDVTGFGFLGHLLEMAGDGRGIRVEAAQVSILPGAYAYAREYILTAGGQRNRKYLADKVNVQINDEALMEVLYDPQTSGGLLAALPEADAGRLLDALHAESIEAAAVGYVVPKESTDIIVY